MKYQVIESNGGGLTLNIKVDSKLVYSKSGFEFDPQTLRECLGDLSSYQDWDGNEVNEFGDMSPAWLNNDEMGLEIIADSKGIYFDKMGLNGSNLFSQK